MLLWETKPLVQAQRIPSFKPTWRLAIASPVRRDACRSRQDKSLTTHPTLCCTCAAILLYKALGAQVCTKHSVYPIPTTACMLQKKVKFGIETQVASVQNSSLLSKNQWSYQVIPEFRA